MQICRLEMWASTRRLKLEATLADCIVEVEVNSDFNKFWVSLFYIVFSILAIAQRQLNDIEWQGVLERSWTAPFFHCPKGTSQAVSSNIGHSPEEAQDVERLQDVCFVLTWNECESVFTADIYKWPPVRIRTCSRPSTSSISTKP